MIRAVVDLPDPDSPTMPSEPPRASVKPMSSTATNSSRPPRGERTWKVLRSPSTESTGSSASTRSAVTSAGRVADSRRCVYGSEASVPHRRRTQRLDRAPVLHHGDAVADRTGQRQVVRDEQQREVAVAAEVGDHRHHLLLRGDVECRRDLVGEQDRRVHREGRRDHHTLQQAARQVAGPLPHAAGRVRDADLGEQVLRAPVGGIRLLPRDGDERLRHEVADRAQRVEVRPRGLEHHAQASRTDVAQAPRRERRDVLAVDADRAAHGEALGKEPGDGTHRQRLARPRLADEAQRLAGAHLQRAVVHEHARSAVGPGPGAAIDT